MVRTFCVVIVSLFLSTSLKAGEQFSTQFQIQHDLFSHLGKVPTPEVVNLQIENLGATKKSPALAAMYSLLLPGLGEYYADGFGSGKYFSVAEGLLWLTYASFDIYGTSLRNDSRTFASARLGISIEGKSDQYFVDLGNFQSSAERDDKRARERDALGLYYNRPGYAWDWGASDIDRLSYKDQRLKGEEMLNNRKFVVAAIILNHVASAINAARSAISYNKDINNQIGELQFKADVMGGLSNPHGVLLTVSRTF
jgi:hypothetical protein